MFLLTAVVAVWIPYFQLQKKIDLAEEQRDSLRKMARELVVDDASKIAIVKKHAKWYDQNRWEIHLPDGEYTIRLATRKIDIGWLAPAVAECNVSGGKHFVELVQSKAENEHLISITLDDQPVINIKESPNWYRGYGSTGGGYFANCEQLPPDKPVVLFRRRFHYSVKAGQISTFKGTTEGLLLWIERVLDEKGEVAE